MSEKKPKNRKRRGRGEGSIYEGADGRWVGRLSLGYDANGKRKRRVVYGETKGEVRAELAKLQGQAANGTLEDSSKLTVAAYLDTWLRDAAKPTLRESTYDTYETSIRLHIKPQIGRVMLAKLTPLHVRSMLAAMEGEYSARRRQYALAVLRRSLGQALKWGMVPRNVCDAVEKPRQPKHEIKPLDEGQAVQFMRALKGEPLELLFVLAVTTGMRQGELLGLQWDDIDLKAGTLAVRRSLRQKRGTFTTDEPKTAKGRRMVELPAMAVGALHEHRVAALAAGRIGHRWVLCEDDGTPISRFRVKAAFARVLKAAKLPTIRFHDLRHSHATMLLSAGVHPKIVQERLGHSQISITLDVYSHVMPGLQREAANRLNAVLSANGHQLATKAASGGSSG